MRTERQNRTEEQSASVHEHKKQRLTGPARIVLICAAAVLALGLGWHLLSVHQSQAGLQQGRQYLKTQAEKNLDDITARLDAREQEEEQQRRDEEAEEITSSAVSIWPLFKDSVIIGDSRAAGFREYGSLPESQVLAVIGTNITAIPDLQDQIAKIQPKVIYVSYGINDVENSIGAANGPNGFGELFEKNLKLLLEKSPHSRIVVNSIMETTPEVAASGPQWAQLPDYNRQIQEMCERNGWTYVDNSSLSQGGNAPIYEPDGIHFLASFYETWARNMLKASYTSAAS